MLNDREIPFNYREYRQDPLSEEELRRVLALLGVEPAAVLRRRDRAFKELGLTGDEPAADLIRAMSEHPTLLERPIGVLGDRAVVGRPVENLLDLA